MGLGNYRGLDLVSHVLHKKTHECAGSLLVILAIRLPKIEAPKTRAFDLIKPELGACRIFEWNKIAILVENQWATPLRSKGKVFPFRWETGLPRSCAKAGMPWRNPILGLVQKFGTCIAKAGV